MTDIRAMIFSGKAEHLLPGLPENSADAVITDPPYGLAELPPAVIVKALTAWLAGDRMHVPDGKGFMGQDWDRFVPPPGIWDECYRVLKPGGHMAVFAGTRTADLMGLSIRLAGFEIRDTLHWLHGQGFPKSLDVSKAIDKAVGAEREVVGEGQPFGRGSMRNRSRVEIGYRPTEVNPEGGTAQITAPATEDAASWEGWGTALKPGHEPILLCRKPLTGTVAANVLEHGTGAMNLAACTVAHASAADLAESQGKNQHTAYDNQSSRMGAHGVYGKAGVQRPDYDGASGRWAPNLLLTHSADCNGNCVPGCPVAGLDAQSGITSERARVLNRNGERQMDGWGLGAESKGVVHGDAGGASRFFPQFTWDPKYDLPFLYQAKAPKSERPRVEGLPSHPTVKPLALMRWLARLLCPPDGLIADPFGGTMTTVQAALAEGFRAVAADSWPDAIAHARVRLDGIEGVAFG